MASSLVIRALIAATRCKQRVILFVSGSVSFSNFVPFDKQFGNEEGIFFSDLGEWKVCEVLAANDSVTPVKPFNLCVCPQGALWQRSARLFTLLLSCALAHGAISSFRLILSNVKLDHLFPVFFIFLLFFFSTTANPRSVHKEFRAWRSNRMRTDARFLSSLTTAFIECLAAAVDPAASSCRRAIKRRRKTSFHSTPVFPPFFCFRLHRSATQKVKCAIYRQVLQANSRR